MKRQIQIGVVVNDTQHARLDRYVQSWHCQRFFFHIEDLSVEDTNDENIDVAGQS